MTATRAFFRTGLAALLLLGLGTTAMASDRVRVFVGVDGYSGDVSYGLSYVGGGRDYRDRYRSYRGGGYWRDGRYYSAPRGYYVYPRPYYRPHYHGYSRGYYGDRHSHDRRHEGRHDRRWDDRRHWHRH